MVQPRELGVEHLGAAAPAERKSKAKTKAAAKKPAAKSKKKE